MNLFLDTSVLLSAAGSRAGSSRALFALAVANRWALQASPWVIAEVEKNLSKLPANARAEWNHLRTQLLVVGDVVTLDRALVFPVSKDRPVLITALAHAHALLTLDKDDFIGLLGSSCYNLDLLLPGHFLRRERTRGRLVLP